jgi:hypothetical protein
MCSKCGGSHFATWKPVSLSLESVRSEATPRTDGIKMLTEEHLAKAICIYNGIALIGDDGSQQWWPFCDIAKRMLANERALSPARVTEGDELSRHLEGEHHAIRALEIDSPMNTCPLKETCQWVKRIALGPAPESPAKDQPGEQLGQGWIPCDAWFPSAELRPCKRCGAQRTKLPDDSPPPPERP